MFFLWNPESRKILLLESEMLGFGIRNTGQGVRSPSNDWNPESKTGIKYRTLNRESTAWKPGSRTVLHGLTEWRYVCWIPLILFECDSVCTVYLQHTFWTPILVSKHSI